MWVTKLLIFPVEISIFCPKTTKFGPKLAFLVNLGQAMQAYSMPCCGSVGGCGARAVSRKTPIYFIIFPVTMLKRKRTLFFLKYVLVIGGLNMQEYIYVCNCAHWGERKYQMLSICEQKWFMLDSACVCGWGRGSFSYQLILHLLPTFCHPSRSFS